MEIVIQWGKLTFCMCMCVVVGGTGVKTWWVSMVFPGVGIGEGGGHPYQPKISSSPPPETIPPVDFAPPKCNPPGIPTGIETMAGGGGGGAWGCGCLFKI